MPAKQPSRARKGRMVRCWAVWWERMFPVGTPTYGRLKCFATRREAVQHYHELMFPEDYAVRRIEIREVLPKRRGKR